jgi:hypothetical protein
VKTVRFLTAVIVGAILTLVNPGVAHASKTIYASTASTAACSTGQIATGGRFTLAAALTSTQHITINTKLSALDSDRPTSTTGSGNSITNTYDVVFDAPLEADRRAAAFNMPDNWNNVFQLASVTCRTAVAATVAARASLPGVDPSVHVSVGNPNDIAAYYEVSSISLGTKRLWVRARATEAVDFAAACSTTYQVVARDGFGTQATTTATMPACAPGELPPPPTSSRPTPSASASASASPSPSESATPEPSASTVVDSDFTPSVQPGGVDPNVVHASPRKASSNWVWSGLGVGLVITAILLGVFLWHSRSRPTDS